MISWHASSLSVSQQFTNFHGNWQFIAACSDSFPIHMNALFALKQHSFNLMKLIINLIYMLSSYLTEKYIHVLHIVPKTIVIIQFKIHIRTHK